MQRYRDNLTFYQGMAQDIRNRYGLEVTPDQVKEAQEHSMQSYRQYLLAKGEVPPDDELTLLLRWHVDYSTGKL